VSNEEILFWEEAKKKAVAQALEGEMRASIELRPDSYIEEIVNDTLTYEGRSYGGNDTSKATWQITRQTKNGSVTTREAYGDGGFKYIWDDRETLFGEAGELEAPPQFLQSFPTQYDNIVCTYVPDTSRILTAVYKLGATVVKTATMTYDGSNRLETITWS
jgi:hypothetical protein